MCGLVGVQLKSGAAVEVAVSMLLKLQHRGQDGAGVSVLSSAEPRQFETARGLGLIDVALKDWPTLSSGDMAIAHTRYATTGTGGVGEVQPFVKGSPKIALAHNGNIINTDELTKKFDLKLDTASDLDVLQQVFLQRQLLLGPNASREDAFIDAVQTIYDEFNGSYAVVGMEQEGTLFGFRDPFGIRPLFFAQFATGYALASETAALTPLEPTKIDEVQPGEWIRLSRDGVRRGRLVSKKNEGSKERFCMFEMIYFSSPQSEYKNESVYRLRFRLGSELAAEIESTLTGTHATGARAIDHFDYVVPVPETSRTAAIAVAEQLAVPYREFLVKNPYVSRTFILNHQESRIKALKSKLSLIGPEIRGKKILLVDDSVVRGNTSRLMALRLREAGATSVSLASTCPPIRHGCYYGIDFPDPNELVANNRNVSEVAESLGVQNLFYLSQDGLVRALKNGNLCLACLDGKYPTRDKSFEDFLTLRRRQREL